MGTDSKLRRQNLGLLRRREILLPTLRGWLFIFLIGASVFVVLAKGVHPFLAITEPNYGGDLIVEGWISDYAFQEVTAEFMRNRYEKLYVTGGPIERGASLCGEMTYAERGAAILRKNGVAPNAVQAVPAPYVARDRTYASAVALKRWLLDHRVLSKGYHIMTSGPHARRTRLLFEKALGEGTIVGVTAIDDPNYDPKQWWNSSIGVRTVISETIAYGYARLLFRPRKQ